MKVEGLGFSYETEKILNDISFSLEDEDILCVVGSSGVGKTTLLKTIAGILYEDEGDIYIQGKNVTNLPSYKRNISFVFQEPNLYPHLTVYQNIDMGIKNRKEDLMKRHKRVTEMMKRFELTRYVNLKPKHLSLGEQQRVALAKCLISEDALYLLDEPISNVDPKSKGGIIELIKEIKKEKKKPFIVVSHNAEDIYRLATKLLVLEKTDDAHEGAKVLLFGEAKEIFKNPVNETVKILLSR